MKPIYKRIVLKVSGEALSGTGNDILSDASLSMVGEQVAKLSKAGVQVGLVVGAGNIFRGRQGPGMQRTTADAMGMISTAINALALKDAIISCGATAHVMSAIEIGTFVERFSADHAINCLEKGEVVVFACGTGNPFFTTDTAAALRALEIGAEALLLAKNIDGVYTADPRKIKDAKRYIEIHHEDVVSQGLQATDLTAITLCMDNALPIEIFALAQADGIWNAACGTNDGTRIHIGAPKGGVIS